MKRKMILIMMGILFCTGCGKIEDQDNGVSMHTEEISENQESVTVTDNTSDMDEDEIEDEHYSQSHETAPQPSEVVNEDAIIGFYSPDPDELEPSVIEFYKEDGSLKYRYFKVLLGNGNGFGISTEQRTVFEYNGGNVTYLTNQGNCYCDSGDGKMVYISFYCYDPTMETIVDQEDGTTFYRFDDFVMPQ